VTGSSGLVPSRTLPPPRNPPAEPSRTLASALHELAEQVVRLRPNWQQPETFFDLRAELAARLRSIAFPRPQ
jgi:hypothetical protein